MITQNEMGQIIVLFTRTKLVKRKKLFFFLDNCVTLVLR